MFKLHSVQITPNRQLLALSAWIDLNDALSIGVRPLDTGGQLALYKAILTEAVACVAKSPEALKFDIKLKMASSVPLDRPDETALLSVGVRNFELDSEIPELSYLQLIFNSAVEGALQRLGFFFNGRRPNTLKPLLELEETIASLKNIERSLGGEIETPLSFCFTYKHTVELANRIFTGNLRIKSAYTPIMLLRVACSYLQLSHKHFTFYDKQ